MAKALQLALLNYREHMQDREYPACFTEQEFKYWKLHEAEVHTLPIRAFACRDCSVAYQRDMLAQGRCPQSNVDISKIAD